MSLNPGTRLGPYEILNAIGAGGISARGRRAERVRDPSTSLRVVLSLSKDEPRRGARRVGGAPRHFLKQTDLAHAGVTRWR